MRPRIVVRLALIAALATVTTGLACGEGPLDGGVGPSTNSLTGTWQGPIVDLTMRLVLTEASGGTVTGTGTMTQNGVPFTLSVTGTTGTNGTFSLNIAEVQHEPFTFSGSVTSGNPRTMTGVGNGSGLINQSITLTKQ
jgi:hypothetical protein